MSSKKLKLHLKNCENALAELKVSLSAVRAKPSGDALVPLFFDACVKRYEVLFEYVWKLLKTAAEFQGSEAPGPRPAIQEGLKYGWIDDAEFWALALDARNGSVHDYFGVEEGTYLDIMEKFSLKVQDLLNKLTGL